MLRRYQSKVRSVQNPVVSSCMDGPGISTKLMKAAGLRKYYVAFLDHSTLRYRLEDTEA